MLRPNKAGSEDWPPITPASARESLPPQLSITPRRPRRTALLAAVPLALSLLASAHRLPASDQPDGPAGQPAQSASPATQPGAQPAPQQAPPEKKDEFKINVDVNLVVLHATVLDRRGGRPVDDLGRDSFRVYEDGVPQKLSVFSHADIPVTMGIVIDDSGSMREKRPGVNAAALTFVKTSNVQDQAFVVNFNDVYYLDTPGDFASNLEDLKSALDKIDSRGGTALYDAVNAAHRPGRDPNVRKQPRGGHFGLAVAAAQHGKRKPDLVTSPRDRDNEQRGRNRGCALPDRSISGRH